MNKRYFLILFSSSLILGVLDAFTTINALSKPKTQELNPFMAMFLAKGETVFILEAIILKIIAILIIFLFSMMILDWLKKKTASMIWKKIVFYSPIIALAMWVFVSFSNISGLLI